MRLSILALLLCTAPAFAAAPVIDNARVTVWDVPLKAGESGAVSSDAFDSVILFLEGGVVKTVHGDGKVTTASHQFGDAVFVARGSHDVDTAVSAAPGGGVHEVVIALKNHPGTPNPSPPGLPNAFPRAGAQKMFENDQALVWKFSWIPDQPVPMHHHDKDTVMVFRYDGPVRSTDPTGAVRILPFARNEIRWSPAGTTHTETLAGEQQSVVDLELK